MDELLNENKKLKEKIQELEEKIQELEDRLSKYTNPQRLSTVTKLLHNFTQIQKFIRFN